MKTFATFFFICISLFTKGQIQKVLSKGEGAKLLMDSTGFYICGNIETNTNDRCGLMRIDTNGNILWQKTYRDQIEFYSYAKDMVKNSDGSLTICGMTFNDTISNEEIALYKVDSIGTKIWSRRIGHSLQDDDMLQIIHDTDGGYLIAGKAVNFNFRQNDFYLIKTDSLGHIVYEKTYGSSGDESCTTLLRAGNRLLLAGDIKDSLSNEYNMAILTIDETGNLLSSVQFPLSGFQSIQAIAIDRDRNLIIAAQCNNAATSNEDNSLIVKLDSIGNTLWSRYIAGAKNFPYTLTTDTAQNIIVGGNFRNSITNINNFVAKINPSGNLIDQKSYGNSFGEKINSFITNNTGENYFTGKYVRTDDLNPYITFNKIRFNDVLCTTNPVTLNLANETISADTISFSTYSDTIEEINSILTTSITNFTDSSLCSLSVGLESPENVEYFLSPIPAADQIQIMSFDHKKIGLVNIFNCIGQKVRETPIENDTFTLDVKSLSNGVYYLSIENDRFRSNKKIIVAHF